MSDRDHPSARRAADEILELCLAGRVRRLARVVDRVYNDRLRELGVRNTQLTVLAMLGHMGEATAIELAGHLQMDKSSLSRTLARMESSGWIAAGGDAERKVELTEHGRGLLLEAMPLWRAAQQEAAERLGAERFDRLAEMLRGAADEDL